jgi:broad specificity phosphatase PhoE
MSELIFVRHGQASFGQKSYDKLSELGVEQVKILAKHWHSLGEEFDHIYCGSLLRQQETAQELVSLVKENPESAKTHRGLNEYNGDPLLKIFLRNHTSENDIEWPIKDAKLFQQTFESATAKWIRNELEPGDQDTEFEAWQVFQNRVRDALDEIMARHTGGSRVLISTSGGVIAMALQRVLGFPDEQVIATNWMVHNSSVTRVRYGNGKLSLTQFNSLPHLEKEGMQHLVTYR